MSTRTLTRAMLALWMASLLWSCSDDEDEPLGDAGGGDAAISDSGVPPRDSGLDATIDSGVDAAVAIDSSAPDAGAKLVGCLDRPGELPRPPGASLPCELVPPGLSLP